MFVNTPRKQDQSPSDAPKTACVGVLCITWGQLSILIDTPMRIEHLLRSLAALASRRGTAGQEIATPQEILDRALRTREREAALRQVLSHYLPAEDAPAEPASLPESSDQSPEQTPAPAEEAPPPAQDSRPARRPAPARAPLHNAAPAARR